MVKQAKVLWEKGEKVKARELLRNVVIRTALDPGAFNSSEFKSQTSIKLSYQRGTSGFSADPGDSFVIGCLLLKLPPALAGSFVHCVKKGRADGNAWAARYFSEVGFYDEALPFARLAVFNEEDASYGGGLSPAARYHFVSAMTLEQYDQVESHALRLLQLAPYSHDYLHRIVTQLKGEDVPRFREAMRGFWEVKLISLPRSQKYLAELHRWK